jgi:hypothetical protein
LLLLTHRDLVEPSVVPEFLDDETPVDGESGELTPKGIAVLVAAQDDHPPGVRIR